MSRFHSYINNACKILEHYKGEVPFAIFTKQYFSKDKKFGSSDRKQISALCYSYFRVGHALHKKINADTLLIAAFLTSEETSPVIKNLQPGWEEKTKLSFEQKVSILQLSIQPTALFPFYNELNSVINVDQFCRSFLIRPDLFIRVRPEHKTKTLQKIINSGISYIQITDNCIRLETTTNIEKFLTPDKEIVIQDYNSQQVLNCLEEYLPENREDDLHIWDCCTASGGKSILLKDFINSPFKLTVSDVRPGIIHNLQQRFEKAAIKNYNQFVADLAKPVNIPGNDKFDIILCDAPCTGSGTWGRTPEQLYFFNASAIQEYAALQRKIVSNAIPHLKENGLFVYITCSVFEKENELVANYIKDDSKLELLKMENLWGYDKKADSMFVAVFKKSRHVLKH
jgi:16S rRNA (cytosine967-C5)-methyltransferase